jgi:hypothetical protein
MGKFSSDRTIKEYARYLEGLPVHIGVVVAHFGHARTSIVSTAQKNSA